MIDDEKGEREGKAKRGLTNDEVKECTGGPLIKLSFMKHL